MKLRGFLKGVCILGLTLLPIFFANAGLQEFDLGVSEEITSNSSLGYTLELQNNANFLLDNQYKVVVIQGAGSYPSKWYYFWNGSGMYLINTCYGGYNCDGSIQGQGFFNYVNIVDLDNIDMNYSVGEGFTSINDFISNSDYYNPDKLLIGGYGDMQTSSLCFGYSDINKAVCFTWNRANWNNCGGQPQYCTNGQLTYISDSLGLTSMEFENISSYFGNSPFTSSVSITGSTVINPKDTAQNIYDSYRRKGYSDTLCYGGFGIDDLYLTGGQSSLRNINIGSGATIFELYNTYNYSPYGNTGLSFVDWYNDWLFEYGFFEDYHDSEENSIYLNKSKGIIGLFMVKEYFFKKDDFSPATLKQFCEFSFANDILIDKTKSPIQVIDDSLSENEINKLIGDLGVIIPSSGTALDQVLATLRGGSGDMEEDFFSYIHSGYDTISSVEFNYGNYPGILPTYIVVGFLGIFLLYVFKH